MEDRPYIELKNIHKSFPGVCALKNVSLSICPGEVHGLVGENGAGKSTLIKVIAGYHQPNKGEYFIEAKPANIHNPNDAILSGIAVVYQELNVVDSLSVAENIFYGRLPRTLFGRVRWKELYENTDQILKRLGMDIDPKRKVGFLSIAQKQLVEIARSISMNPKIIIMDEPTSALAPAEIEKIVEIVKKLKEQQVGILYISHKLEEIMEICDRVTVLRDGEFIQCIGKDEVDETKLINLMVGRNLDEMYTRTNCAGKEIALNVSHLSTDKVRDISFYVRKGEIVGFSGLMGAGRTELAKGIYGADIRRAGTIEIFGESLQKNSKEKAVRMGMGFIPEDRKDEGILPNLSVGKNTTISSMASCALGGIIRHSRETKIADQMIADFRIKTPDRNQLIVNLSGGNQQKVLISRWLSKENLKILIVDEPTRGIDVGAKEEIYNLLDELAQKGLAVIVMSSEMQEILGVCDRIYVMRGGKIVKEYAAGDATQEKLLESAI